EIDAYRRYRRIWRYSVLLTLVVAITPLIVLTEVNLYQYRKNLHNQIQYDISRTLSSASRSLEFIIRERISALEMLSREQTPAELERQDRLADIFRNLRESFGGFVDLGVIDRNGVQVSYIGPYELLGVNYRDQAWFHEVSLRGVYVSDVFMGFRHFPHFVIAVKRETAPDGFFILRATVDMELLNELLAVADRGRAGDAFLINREGVLQTDSRAHGKLLEPCPLPVPPYSAVAEVIEDAGGENGSYVLGYRYIESSPFILMVIKRRGELAQDLGKIRTEVISFLIISAILILLVVLWSVTTMVKHIRAADQRHDRMLHNIEYTNKMATIGRLSASVAHEINNPLAIINEKAGLLKDLAATKDFPYKEKTLASLDSIIQSVQRCSEVTHRLLGFTRRLEARKERIDLGRLLNEVLGFLGKEALHRNIIIETDYPEDIPTIISDRGKLQQIFLNIINNAFAAVKKGGKIIFSLRPLNGRGVSVTICDNGTGISEENLKHIFEPFFSTKGEFGTGLGLSITYGLVQKLGGSISVKSKLGEGTCFTVELPLESPAQTE
ncbi:MAG TPA: sensor histidine kinase, partial [Bacteroidetes bacterium]|nr:sensor histidine kinase [Bacteroidota bacterium]